jgi:hypothetical protein
MTASEYLVRAHSSKSYALNQVKHSVIVHNGYSAGPISQNSLGFSGRAAGACLQRCYCKRRKQRKSVAEKSVVAR